MNALLKLSICAWLLSTLLSIRATYLHFDCALWPILPLLAHSLLNVHNEHG